MHITSNLPLSEARRRQKTEIPQELDIPFLANRKHFFFRKRDTSLICDHLGALLDLQIKGEFEYRYPPYVDCEILTTGQTGAWFLMGCTASSLRAAKSDTTSDRPETENSSDGEEYIYIANTSTHQTYRGRDPLGRRRRVLRWRHIPDEPWPIPPRMGVPHRLLRSQSQPTTGKGPSLGRSNAHPQPLSSSSVQRLQADEAMPGPTLPRLPRASLRPPMPSTVYSLPDGFSLRTIGTIAEEATLSVHSIPQVISTETTPSDGESPKPPGDEFPFGLGPDDDLVDDHDDPDLEREWYEYVWGEWMAADEPSKKT